MSQPINSVDINRALMAKRWFEWGVLRIWRWWVIVAGIALPMHVIEGLTGYDFTASNKIHTGLLQLLGVVFFLAGIRDTLKRFQKPSAVARVRAWLKEIPIAKRQHVMAAGCASMGVFGASARGRVFMPPNESKTLEQRLKDLEYNQTNLFNEIDQVYRDQVATNDKLRASVEQERRDRAAQVSLVSGLLEETTVGGVHDLYMAAALTIVSTLLSTVGLNHLEAWFRWLHFG